MVAKSFLSPIFFDGTMLQMYYFINKIYSIYTVDRENFGVKKFRKPHHTFTKLKHTKNFYYEKFY